VYLGKMAESQLRLQLDAMQQEVGNLRGQLMNVSLRPKDLSTVALIPKWSGTDSSVSLGEFFEKIESAGKLGNWSDTDKLQVATLKLTELAKIFYSSNVQLQNPEISWKDFKGCFQARFKEVHTDQYHFIRLQTARQGRDETPQAFADRCRSLANKTVPKVADPTVQKLHYDHADRMLLAAFISGLSGNPGQQVRFRMPRSLEEALQIAVTVHEAEAEEKRRETFYADVEPRERRVGRVGHPWHRKSQVQPPKAIAGRSEWKTRTKHFNAACSRPEKPCCEAREISEATNTRTASNVRCWACSKLGHYARDCYSRNPCNQPNKNKVAKGKEAKHQQASKNHPQGNE
jgi:hypothetical protein